MKPKIHNPCVNSNVFDSTFPFSKQSPASIDSFKIRVPLHNVDVLHSILTEEFVVVSSTTGEIIDDENFKKSAYFHEDKGCKTYYRIEKQGGYGMVTLSYLTILVTSKANKWRYFEGINLDTSPLTYENLMQQGVVWFPYNVFMDGECTDMDIKIDFIPEIPVINIVNNLYAVAKSHKLAHKAASRYRTKDNLGIQFALRKTEAFATAPYLKLYEKVRELNTKSIEFKENNLSHLELPPEILRVETTIKNKKHFKTLGQGSTKFEAIVVDLHKVSKTAFKKAFKAHLDGFQMPTPKKEREDLKPMDKVLLGYIIEKMVSGHSFSSAKQLIIDSSCVGKKQRYRMSKSIDLVAGHINFDNKIGDTNLEAFYSDLMQEIKYRRKSA